MKKIQREDIHIISHHSNLEEQAIEKALQTNVFNDKSAWQKFLQLLFITLGVGFLTSGIVFFFAYNWADLHKFIKLGLIEGLLILTTILAFVPKINLTTRKIILTGTSILVGVLFAVFGQIYQTGANAYDFFMAWTIFISLWVLISNFAPLWLLYVIVINTTIILYSQQVAKDWSAVFVCNLLFILNTAILIISELFFKKNIPHWFLNIVALGAITCATFGISFGIFDLYEISLLVLIPCTGIAYFLGIWYGLKKKSSFYLSIIPFSLIIITSALLIKISTHEIMFLIITFFIVISVALTILNLIALQKKWNHEK